MTSGPIGFFGKLPAHGDFVRLNVGDPLAQRFTRWLEEASEACHRARVVLPRAPIRFLFRAAGEGRALAGALRGSQDRVGRQFPLALFAPVEGPLVERSFPALPFALGGFLAAAGEALATDAAAPAALAERAAALRGPGPEDAAAAEAAARAAATRPAREALPRLFPELSPRLYAFNTFLAGCAAVRGREPARAETVLDCPALDASDAWAWLELARRALRWSGSPSWLEAPGSPGRLLVSLGAPPPAVLSTLGEPRRDSPKVWPLVTAVAAAAEAARKALGPSRAAALEREGATFEELAAELAGGEA